MIIHLTLKLYCKNQREFLESMCSNTVDTPQKFVTVVIKVCIHAQLLSHIWLFATLWNVGPQAPLSIGFSRQEYKTGFPSPSSRDLPNPGIRPTSPEHGFSCRWILHPLSHLESPRWAISSWVGYCYQSSKIILTGDKIGQNIQE